MPRTERIIISDKKHGLPFSKGLMAQSIMATGLSPSRAWDVAEAIEGELLTKKAMSVTSGKLKEIVFNHLRDNLGQDYADHYIGWQDFAKLDKPVIILIGGTTGVGKSTIASQLAHRIGITRLNSTDAVREIMRTFFSIDLLPAIYYSSFQADTALRVPVAKSADPLLLGFEEQVREVTVGTSAIIERAVKETTSIIVEGVHCVPGYLNLEQYEAETQAIVVPLVVAVKDEELHRSHFIVREIETESSRPFKRYIDNFDKIRTIQAYIMKQAEDNCVRVFDSVNLDGTVNEILDLILERVQKKTKLMC